MVIITISCSIAVAAEKSAAADELHSAAACSMSRERQNAVEKGLLEGVTTRMKEENPDSYELLAGWVIDGTGGPIERNILMRVANGVIESVEKVPAADPAILHGNGLDLSRCTVLPGLVDCHVHLTMSGTPEPEIRRMQLGMDFEQAEAVIAERIRRQLAHGIVALRDGGDSAGHTLRYQKQCLPANGNSVYLKAAGKAWHSRGRYGKSFGRPPAAGFTLAQAIENQGQAADHVKIINAGLNSLTEFAKQTASQFPPEILAGAVRAARRRHQRVMAHANGPVPVRQAVAAGCHSIEHGFFMGRENLQRMAERQTVWVPTAFSMRALARHLPPAGTEVEVARKNLDHQLEQLAAARQVGVPVAVGTDCGSLGIHHGKAFVEELTLFLEAGFPIAEAVRCATLEGAGLLGLEKVLGRLQKGMPATFVAVAGDPSALPEALHDPQHVYLCGRPVGTASPADAAGV